MLTFFSVQAWTTSFYYFWDNFLKVPILLLQTGWTTNTTIPFVRIDPENRCGVLLSYGRGIVVLPIRKEITTKDEKNPEGPQPAQPMR